MKIKSVIQIRTESIEEEQYILKKFPQAYWVTAAGINSSRDMTTFYLESKYANEAVEVVREWKEKTK